MEREGGKGEEEEMQERRRNGEEGVEREEREGEVERRVKERLREWVLRFSASTLTLPHHIPSHALTVCVCSQFHRDPDST